MVDHRRLQRTLFLMQLDRGFAQRVHAGDEKTCRLVGLCEEGLSWLQDQELAAISADPGNKRRMQIVGNIAGEYTLSLLALTATNADASWLEEFFLSARFQRAVLEDDRLPLAFGDYTLEDARKRGWTAVAAVIEIEQALARLRREAVGGPLGTLLDVRPPQPPGTEPLWAVESGDDPLWLSERARLLEAPAGTHAWCEALQAGVDAGTGHGSAPGPPAGFPPGERETVLLFAHQVENLHRPAQVRTELLAPPVDEVLRRARGGFAGPARAAFARKNGATPEELEGFLEGFLDEGVLERR